MRLVFASVLLLIVGKTIGAGDTTLVVSLADEQRLDTYAVSDTGALLRRSRTATTSKPAASCFDATGRHLYVAGTDPASISVFRADEKGLTALQVVDVPAKPSYLRVSPSGQFLLASYFVSGQVTVHRIVGEGRLSNDPLRTLKVDANAHCVSISPDGRFVFVPHTRPSRISQFCFDDKTGELTPNDPPHLQLDETAWPRHLWFHPSGQYAFVSNERGRSVSVFECDETTGLLTENQTLSSMPAKIEGKATTSRIEADPSGRFVYVANRGHGTIAAYQFDPSHGKLTYLQHAQTSPSVRGFGVSPRGDFLVAAGLRTNKLFSFHIGDDGRLSAATTLDCGKTPWWVTFSPTARGQATKSPSIAGAADRRLTLGQGTMAGEVSDTSVLLQARLTRGRALDQNGALPGGSGVIRFEWSSNQDFTESTFTEFEQAVPARDFIVRHQLKGLRASTKYFFRAIYGVSKDRTMTGPTCSFRTLPGIASDRQVSFIVGSCMNYNKFMHGRVANAKGPLTATAEDKRLGFPAFATMAKMKPEFFVGTGDIVYYDNPFRVARSVEELRKCWHEQFRFPRMVDFFREVPAYWSKDDHDFRYNDSDNETSRIPLSVTGIGMFREQLPIAPAGDVESPNYRTHRVSKHLQIWLTEGRDHRSANKSPDGPDKTMWGKEQLEWLKTTILESDAKWKIMVNPTPMVGPDDGYKSDNHANLNGFRHEADAFFAWVKMHQLETHLTLVCGDRHWQYHSIHPSGVHEFACGALNDENSRMGVLPGAEFGSDPERKVRQPFTSPEPSGGFLHVRAGASLQMTHFTDDGKQLYEVVRP